MLAEIYARTKVRDDLLDSIVSSISSVDCSCFFSNQVGSSQSEQKVDVMLFQLSLLALLQKSHPEINWSKEYAPSQSSRDAIDIFGKTSEIAIVIEMDKGRADQVSKKFVSRVALLGNAKLIFISLCYPGTERMNFNECKKYFGYCASLADRMAFSYAGLAMRA